MPLLEAVRVPHCPVLQATSVSSTEVSQKRIPCTPTSLEEENDDEEVPLDWLWIHSVGDDPLDPATESEDCLKTGPHMPYTEATASGPLWEAAKVKLELSEVLTPVDAPLPLIERTEGEVTPESEPVIEPEL